MTLAHVGSNLGPDHKKLEKVLRIAGTGKKANIYAAGGIRNMADVANLELIGVAGALVATALHNGSITSQDIAGAQD
jgi:phosphoribosylformimino-5-aminoimidazole carboxamide ribotide isomerase